MAAPIAVVGIGCRFPGAYGPEEFWALLRDGRDAVTEVSPDRFNVAAVYDPRPATPGRIPTRAGGFLDRIDEFDAAFFGIAPREAAHMDPQQRLLLETGWEAVEDAGLLPGPRTGVFIGQMTGNYWDLLSRARALDIYANIGTTRSALAGRLSYALDLRGPSVTVDTACSSSLVAVHLAVQSLRRGECEVALAGGVNVILHPDETITFAQAKMISPEGRCAFGAAGADGFVRSEGVGVVVLEPLEAALADGDSVYAVIHGSAVGNDGRASGYLMTPARDGQAETMRAAYADAGVEPADVHYVEAHGTGSAAGDPVELAGLAAVFDGPLFVGSVKTNIGHTEAAAGIAGLIKAVLCVRHREIPASLHGTDPGLPPGASGGGDGIVIVRGRTPWPAGGAIAGVSSFGISGTNAHVVVGEPPPRERRVAEQLGGAERREAEPGDARSGGAQSGGTESDGAEEAAAGPAAPRLLVISARTPEALSDLAAAYAAHSLTPLGDVCRTAATRRRHHESRLTVVGSAPDEIAAKLRAHSAGEPVPLLGTSDDVVEEKAKVVYVFPGQGSQWTGMGRELMTASPVFRDTMAACDRAIRAETGRSVLEGDLDGIDVVQPALWAIEVALAAVWRSYGIGPDAVIGHSMGEVAAACAAGLLDLTDGAAVICRRSRLLAGVAGQGAMLSVDLSEADAAQEIADLRDEVSVAVCNGPGSTVLSGDPAALEKIAARLDARGVFCRRVRVDVASHSPQMDPLLGPLRKQLRSLTSRPGTTPFHSTVADGPVTVVDAAYWARNLRAPVHFGQAVRDQGRAIFIELSPHPILIGAIIEAAESGLAVPSLRRGEPEAATLLDGLGTLYRAGYPVPWQRVYGPGPAVRLPRHPWRRRRYWLDESADPSEVRAAPPPSGRTDRERPGGSLRNWVVEHSIDRPYLADHRVRGEPVLPGTAYLEMALSGAPDGTVLREVRYREPLVLTGAATSLRVTFTGDRFEISGGNVVHVTGRLASADERPRPPGRPAPEFFRRDLGAMGERRTGAEFYARSAADGNQWAGAFRAIAELWRADGRAAGRIEPPPGAPFPAVLDACCQVLAAAGLGGPFLLAGIEEVRLHRPLTGRPLRSHATAVAADGSLTGDVLITDADGAVLAELTGVRLRYLAAAPSHLYGLRWRQLPPPAPSAAPRDWVILADANGVGAGLAERLAAAGHRCTVVTVGDGFARPGSDRLVIDPAAADDYRRMLAGSDGAGVVHLWSLDTNSAPDTLRSALLLAQAAPVARLWFVTRGAQPVGGTPVEPDQAALWGFVRALAQEHSESGATLIDLDTAGSDGLYAELTAGRDGEPEIALRGGERYAPRLVPSEAEARDPAPEGSDAAATRSVRAELRDGGAGTARRPPASGTAEVTTETPGLLDTIRLRPGARPGPAAGEVEIAVRTAGLNYRDVLIAMNAYPGQDGEPTALGWECAGTVTAVGTGVAGLRPGDEVIALANPALAGHVRADARLVFPRPARLRPEDAVSMPVAFLTAYHALCGLARLREGERVLIHSATGGVGLAAIQIARWKGAEILATAGDTGKRALLGMLGVRHVFDSRSLGYADEVRAVTRGAGVDVVLNTLTGEAFGRNLSLLAPYGRHVELGKRDLVDGTRLDLRPFARNLAYLAVDVADMIRTRPAQAAEILGEVLRRSEAGIFTPLPHTVFAAAEASAAFRHLARARHVGKVVLSFGPGDGLPAVTSGPVAADRPQAPTSGSVADDRPVATDETWTGGPARIDPGATYLVTGGLGDLGRIVARWLAESGARHLLLVGRTPRPDSPVLGEPAHLGVQVEYAAIDVADEDALRDLLERRAVDGRPPVRGVVHAAGAVAFRLVAELQPDQLDAVLRPKVAGGWALHRVLRETPLDFFVLFSSASAVLGSPMLAAYAAANAFLDGLAHHRRAAGLPALAVDWGFWTGAGMAARFEAEHGRPLTPDGMASFSPAEGIRVLRALMAGDAVQALVLPTDWGRWRTAHPEAARVPLLRELLADTDPAEVAAAGVKAGDVEPGRGTEAGRSDPLTGRTVEEYLLGEVAKVLGLPVGAVSPLRPLKDQGIDSLMAVEVRTRVRRDLGVPLPVGRILGGSAICELAADLTARLNGAPPPGPAGPGAG
jgi:phthiocerol/phenolphthiocerol synthesis type-I polyketide synthase C